MRLTTRLLTSTTFAFLATQAVALTGEEVWANQTAYLSGLGITVSQTQTRAGNVLTVSDIAYDLTFPFAVGRLSLRSGPQTYTENADGSVDVGYAPVNTLALYASILPGPGDALFMAANLTVATQGQTMKATGTADDITYDSRADLMEITLSDVVLSGESDLESVSLDAYLSIEDSVTTVRITTGAATTLTGTSVSGRTVSDVGISIGEEMQSKTVSLQSSTNVAYSLTLPAAPMDLMDMSQALRDGLAMTLEVGTGAGRSQEVSMAFGTIISNQSTTVDSSSTRFRLDAQGIGVAGSAEQAVISLDATDDLPLKIDASLESLTFEFAFPLNSGTAPVEAVYAFGVTDLVLTDDLWAMIDRTGAFPRQPLSFALDLRSNVTLKTDLLDIAGLQMMIESGQMPFDVQSVRIGNLSVNAAGASAVASGEFTLDMTDLDSFDGFPRPTGSAMATVTGANALLDSLLRADWISADDLTAARLAMSMFATATGDDQLQSTLEINAEGHVIANGQRIQ